MIKTEEFLQPFSNPLSFNKIFTPEFIIRDFDNDKDVIQLNIEAGSDCEKEEAKNRRYNISEFS